MYVSAIYCFFDLQVQSCSYDRKLRAKTQSLKDELEQEKRQSSKLSAAIEKLEEKVALSKSKVTADSALSVVKKSHGAEVDPPTKAP
ncbi:hypothetical protein WN944_001423 [Citrus x changshan-huyou]|uniref:Uncharacterized protein n=1 Tax=Citrus x changshan-huyou TaxID=2935761 RepID=A0AAP0MGH6_9ROSI